MWRWEVTSWVQWPVGRWGEVLTKNKWAGKRQPKCRAVEKPSVMSAKEGRVRMVKELLRG